MNSEDQNLSPKQFTLSNAIALAGLVLSVGGGIGSVTWFISNQLSELNSSVAVQDKSLQDYANVTTQTLNKLTQVYEYQQTLMSDHEVRISLLEGRKNEK